MKSKFRVFIGSSTDGADLAVAVKAGLGPQCECTPWFAEALAPATNLISSLVEKLTRMDFAVLVMRADDVLEIANKRYSCPRDNVVFEMGLAMGTLGQARTFAVIGPKTKLPLRVPTDLLAHQAPRIETRSDHNESAAALTACLEIRKRMQVLGHRKRESVEVAVIANEHLRDFASALAHEPIAAVQRRPGAMPEGQYLAYLTNEVKDLGRGDALFAICGGKDYQLSEVFWYLNENVRIAMRNGAAVNRLYVAPRGYFEPKVVDVIDAHREWARELPNFRIGVLAGEGDCRELHDLKLPDAFGLVVTRHGHLWKGRIHYGLARGTQDGWEFCDDVIVNKIRLVFKVLAQRSKSRDAARRADDAIERTRREENVVRDKRLWRVADRSGTRGRFAPLLRKN